MSLRLIPLSQKVHLLGHDSTAEGDILGQGPRRPARGRPKAVFLLLASCTQEEDAGPPRPVLWSPVPVVGTRLTRNGV